MSLQRRILTAGRLTVTESGGKLAVTVAGRDANDGGAAHPPNKTYNNLDGVSVHVAEGGNTFFDLMRGGTHLVTIDSEGVEC